MGSGSKCNCVYWIYLCILHLLCGHVGTIRVPANVAQQLYRHLIVDQDYNKYIRPAANFSNPTYVDVSLKIINILDFDEISQMLSITGKLYLYWTDDYLTWDPANYSGVDAMSFPQNEVWKPDIALENSVNKYADLGAVSMYVLVTNDGRVKWKPLEVFRSTCTINVKYFPLDIQECCLHFESWSHVSGTVVLRNAIDYIQFYGFSGHPQWAIIATTSMTRVEGDDMYVTFCITMKRKAMYVLLNVVMPVAFLSVLSIFVFTLPVESGEKASFTVTVFLSLAVFLTIVSGQLPKTSDHVALFNVYVFAEVMMSTLITIVTLIQMRLYHTPVSRRVPLLLRMLVNCRMCFRRKIVTSSGDSSEVKTVHIDDRESDKDIHAQDMTTDDSDWKNVANCIGLLLFWTFLLINFLFTLAILLSIVTG